MKVKIAKTISFLLILAITFAMFAGCGSDPTIAAPSDPTVAVPSDPHNPKASTPAATVPVQTDPTGTTATVPSGTEPPHLHQYSENVVLPTCTEAGYTQFTCGCGDVYVADKVDAPGHCWGNWMLVKAPTEEAEGEEKRDCANCNASEKQAIARLEHTHKYSSQQVEAGCTTEGYTIHTCSCGDSFKTETKDPLGHQFTEYKGNNDATCTTDGTQTAKCSRCTKTDTIPDEGSATGHRWGDWVVTKEPTSKTEGEKKRECGDCGAAEKSKIEKLPQQSDGLTVVSWTKTVHRNEDATVTIQGKPGQEYSIEVHYSSGVSKAEGLENKVADEDGFVTWIWHVGGRTKAGTYKIIIRGGGEEQTIEFTVIVN